MMKNVAGPVARAVRDRRTRARCIILGGYARFVVNRLINILFAAGGQRTRPYQNQRYVSV